MHKITLLLSVPFSLKTLLLKPQQWLLALGILFHSLSCFAAESPTAPSSLAEEIQEIKASVIDLNRDLLILEENLLFPAQTQISVFVSLDTGKYFKLDAVELKLDGETVTTHLYTDQQISALERGGLQKLYMGNIKTGPHQLIALFTGYGPENREYRRAAELNFEKGTATALLEIKITDNASTQQPDFVIEAVQGTL